MLGRKRPLLRTHDIYTEAILPAQISITGVPPPTFYPLASTRKLSQTTQIWYGGEARWLDFTTESKLIRCDVTK